MDSRKITKCKILIVQIYTGKSLFIINNYCALRGGGLKDAPKRNCFDSDIAWVLTAAAVIACYW